MKRKKKYIKRISKYWICSACVHTKHPDWGKINYPVTCTSGLCGHCRRKDETSLTPVCDYPKPGHRVIWD